MRTLALCLVLLLSASLSAQQPLSASRRNSVYQYVYKIEAAEALKLYRTGMNKIDERFLHTLIDSSLTDSMKPPVLRPGNYLLVEARENRLLYELKTVGNLHMKLVNNNRDLVVVLHNKEGRLVSDAKVYFNKKRIPFDRGTQSFRLARQKKEGNIIVHHNGVVHHFPLEEVRRPYSSLRIFWNKVSYRAPLKYVVQPFRTKQNRGRRYREYFYTPSAYEKNFRGFMVFSKPMYRPHDTVRVKAYAMKKNGHGLQRRLLLRLSDRSLTIDTVLAVIDPYRRGGYEYSFVLSDSLDLDLDLDYMLTLEEERSRKYGLDEYEGDLDNDDYALKRKIVMRGKFRFEEYELKSTRFTARSSQKEHSRGEAISVFAKATDENELPVLDGRIKLAVTVANYTLNSFHAPKVFLPDTLWQHTQPLEQIGETKISLPDSIFPDASFSYQVHCTFLNSNNESRSHTLYQTFNGSRHKIRFEAKADSLFVDYLVNGKPVNQQAWVYTFGSQEDTMLAQQLSLPARLPLHPFAQFYRAVTDSTAANFQPEKEAARVYASARRTRDSIVVQLANPFHMPVWYTIYAGEKVVHRGYGDSLLYIDKVRTPKNYFVSLQYIFGGRVYSEDYTIPYRDKLLNIEVKQPQFVYPGQQADITIRVADADGKPVADADVTAYAFTQKFPGHTNPAIPYLGKYYPMRKRYSNFALDLDKDFIHAGKLRWERWSREMGLDSIEYFKFLHPKDVYINRQPAKDNITQIAPFVVWKGELQPVHHIYIDERPVFFSQSQHLQRYSFNIPEGKHALKLRTHNRLISIDSIVLVKGMKTFISINADTSNKMVRLQRMPDTLTNPEKTLWSKYSIVVENTFGEKMAVIEQLDRFYLLNFNDRFRAFNSGSFLVGPLRDQFFANLTVRNRFTQDFAVESGYLFNISKGLIKQKQWRHPYYHFGRSLSHKPASYNFSDFVLTANEIDSLWQDYLDHRSAVEDLFVNAQLNRTGNGKLMIGVGKDNRGKDVFVKNVFLFRYDDPDFARVYKGISRDLGYVQPGNYRLFLLLKGDEYFIVDSIRVQKDGVNYYESGVIVPNKRDSVSVKIAAIVNNREKNWLQSNPADLNSIKETFNDQYLDATSFSRTIIGRVKDGEGNPVAGAAVVIKGTRRGVATDALGNFRLGVPERATVVVSSVGYTSVERKFTGEHFYDIVLPSAKMSLEDVVVVGYGTQKRASMTGSVVTIDQALQGRVAGISIGNTGNGAGLNIRGIASVSGSTAPALIIVDGVPFSGTLEDIDPAQIANINVLSGAAATAIYGSNGANGVMLVTTNKAKSAAASPMDMMMAAAGNLRRNFRDDAWWQPKLRTDAEGKASFTVTFPDDITNWRTHVVAVAGNKQTGFAEGAVKSFKTLSANLGLPQFAIEGDSIHVIGKMLHYMPDSVRVKRTFSYNGSMVKEGSIGLRNSWIDTFPLRASKDDSLTFKYTIQKEDGYFDGEERKVPVFKQGVLETKGLFAVMENDTSFTITTDSSLGTVNVFAESSVFPVLEEEMERIRRYEYLCNEQLASKLKALLLRKQLCSHLDKGFEGEKDIREILSRLNQNRSQNLWGWWSNNAPQAWISLHVVEAMLMAEKAGYKINLNKQVVIDYLVYHLESYPAQDRLFTLNLLHGLDAKVDYNQYLDTLQKQMKAAARVDRLSLYDQLRWLELKQKTGAKVSLDTLVSKARKTMFGNMYWGEENRRFFDNSVQITLLMYRLMKAAGGYERELKKVRNYFLEKRKDGNWRNTYESSLILETILPDLLMKDRMLQPASLTVTGERSAIVETFPFAAQVKGGQAITVVKKGGQPVYFTAYQQQWNAVPQKVDGDFTVTSFFEKAGQQVAILKGGEQVTLKVNVGVKADADYVLIEVPIPAGCSYADKLQPRWSHEVHREYFKNKVSIFCASLPRGTYTFTISLMPRYSGLYHLNPAKAELMYFPTFFGREEMKKVKID